MKKQLYKLLCACGISLITTTFFTTTVNAQSCSCANGDQPNIIEYRDTLHSTMASNSTLSFPKFDLTLGTLTCVSLFDTLTIVATVGARNRDATSAHTPTFQLTVPLTISGPSLSITDFKNVIYGPDYLEIFGMPGDSITYGPDTVYRNVAHKKTITSSSDLSGYTGLGNVSFNYGISGGAIPIFDGTNYTVTFGTNTWAVFKLVYSWCEHTSMAANIQNFIAGKKSNTINLSWQVANDEPLNSYEILISTDGKNFTKSIKVPKQPVTEGVATKYTYQYTPDPSYAGKLYFRIKQIDATGQPKFSAAQFVNLASNAGNEVSIYPNPAKTSQVAMQFSQVLKGNYAVELINITGQVIYRNTFKLNNTNTLQLTLPTVPPAGMYHLRAREVATGETFTNKLMIQQ
ncbi:MAG: choice-of-anchor E domain-containing protein [Chitinophagaceae bacterium]